MKIVVYLLAAAIGTLGLLFLIAAGQANAIPRVVIGVLCLAVAGTLIAVFRLRPTEQVHVSKIDLSGDVSLEKMTCQQCGGTLGRDSVVVKAGAVFVNCEFCGAQYQLEEAPKW